MTLQLQTSLCNNSMEINLMKYLLLAVLALFGVSAAITTDVHAADWRDGILGNTTYDSAPAAKPRTARAATSKAANNAARPALVRGTTT